MRVALAAWVLVLGILGFSAIPLLRTGTARVGTVLVGPRIELPIEVLGPSNTTESVTLTLSEAEATNAAQLSLLVSGVQYGGKMEVTINSQVVVCNSNTVIIPGYAGALYGFGGGFETLSVRIPITNSLLTGSNRLSFRYPRQESYAVNGFTNVQNRMDDASSGFRIIAINLRNASGAELLGGARFYESDPRTWTYPDSVTNDLVTAITNGWKLWHGTNPATGSRFQLFNPVGVGLTPTNIWASCADCHFRSGRDLRIFNYSNKAIQFRAVFHGLSTTQGDWITAYIRSLDVDYVTNGRPWNPPFQPVAGLDSLPPLEWFAGGGYAAIATNQSQIIGGMFPGAYHNGVFDKSLITTNSIEGTNRYSIREVPVHFEFALWSHWLSRSHPADSYAGRLATNGTMATAYTNALTFYATAHAHAATNNWAGMFAALQSFINNVEDFKNGNTNHDLHNHTLLDAQRQYALGMWAQTRVLEITDEYNLWDLLATNVCGESGEPRSVVGLRQYPFNASPTFANNQETIEAGLTPVAHNGSGIGNGLPINFHYWSAAWYHMQLLLANGNRTNACGRNAAMPWDIPYSFATFKDVCSGSISNGWPHMPVEMLSVAELASRVYDNSQSVSNAVNLGNFSPDIVRIGELPLYDGSFTVAKSWADAAVVRSNVVDAVYWAWFRKGLLTWPASHYQSPRLPTATSFVAFYPTNNPTVAHAPASTAAGVIYALLSQTVGTNDLTLGGYNVSTNLRHQVVTAAQAIWPTNNNGTSATATWEAFRP